MLRVSPRERDPIREAHRQWVRHGWADAADGMVMVTSLVRVQQLHAQAITLGLPSKPAPEEPSLPSLPPLPSLPAFEGPSR